MNNNERESKQVEPKLPDPEKADQKPDVDLSNEIKKGSEIPKER